jgi:hypothetical protein
LSSRKFSKNGKNTGLHKGKPTIATGDEFHDISNGEAQINDCDNIDSGENIDSEDDIDTIRDQQHPNKKLH